MQKVTRICIPESGAILSRALQAHTGQAEEPIKELSAVTGIKVDRLYKMRQGHITPNTAELLTMIGVLPASFLNMLTECVGVGGARKLDNNTISHAEYVVLTSGYSQEYVERISDLVLCHVDKRALDLKARKIAGVIPTFGDLTIDRLVA